MKLLKSALLLCLIFFPVSEVFAEGAWTTYTNPSDVNDFAVYEDYLWCATKGGVLCIDTSDKSYVKYTTIDGLPDNYVYSIDVDNNGIVWCYSHGFLGRYDGAAWQTYNINISENIRHHGLTISDDNNVWLVSTTDQIKLFDGNSLIIYNDDLVDIFTIRELLVNSENDIWAISILYGVAHYNGLSWTFYDKTSELGTSQVYDITEDSHGIIWVATYKGVASFDGFIWTKYYDNSLFCRSIAIGSENTIWVGSKDELWSFDKTIWSQHITRIIHKKGSAST